MNRKIFFLLLFAGIIGTFFYTTPFVLAGGGGGGGDCPSDPHCLSYGAITSVTPNQFEIGTVSEITAFYKYGSLNTCGNITFSMKVDTYLDRTFVSTKLYPDTPSGQYVDSELISVIGLLAGTHRVDMVFTDLANNLTQTNHRYFLITSGPQNSPVGFHDDSSCDATVGWACDPDDYHQSLVINLYDGPGFANPLGSLTANQTRSSLVADQCGGVAKHGFIFPTPNSIKDGLVHSIYAYATNIGLGNDVLLSQSPRNIICGAPPSSFNYTLLNSGTSNVTKTSGNAFTQNTITKTLTSSMTEPVTLSLSGVPGGTSYSISNSACSPTCFSVITFTVSPGTAAGTYPITVTGTPLGKQTGFNLAISGNPMNVTCSASPSTALLGQTVTWTANVSGGTPPLVYSWSGTNFPTTPPPSTNPFSIVYSTIGQKLATVTVTDTDSVTATCLAGTVQINFDPNFEEF